MPSVQLYYSPSGNKLYQCEAILFVAKHIVLVCCVHHMVMAPYMDGVLAFGLHTQPPPPSLGRTRAARYAPLTTPVDPSVELMGSPKLTSVLAGSGEPISERSII
jgi:hypothetical protein